MSSFMIVPPSSVRDGSHHRLNNATSTEAVAAKTGEGLAVRNVGAPPTRYGDGMNLTGSVGR
ncbi:MAG: hypothetical protein J0L91_08840 [Burkholderiales bacterium]|nr:hypothetical protein [Burkholderiales bacterium]